MKGTKLFILILLGVIIFFIIYMYIVSGGDLTSWSAADLTKFRWMLLIILASIGRLWWKFADKHKLDNQVLLHNWHDIKIDYKKHWIPNFKIIKRDYTLRTAFEICGWLFIGIAVFGLSISVVVHYIFTIAAALATLITVIKSVPKGSKRTLYGIGFGIGIIAWALGFATDLWTVYLGEVIFFITPAIWVLNEVENVEE